ncbi:cell division ATP-binding protein FtsE [Gluconobacter sphaericus]|uniref:cell division ATP-binding protein FtsE n=1 Tax=Gluconobacter sphaericus TaxID=574987 RepID=UPI001B8CD5BE|nr:ATP-binding cassette domain-containing protein [Gluconobacter sphaericus]MBS1085533.1 ATP-binding cassette domain-containing protein [Gluconobacter sphaericus]MBS1099329.1 ATP-binding cassette domain-containing protein [Gluconobacter sphaericus]
MIRLLNVSMMPPDVGQPVLRNLTLTVPQGEFRWLLGASGAGKSSLLRLLTLETRPSAGQMDLLGVSISQASRTTLRNLRRRIGFVPQDYRLIGEWTVFDNVALPLRLRGASERDTRREAFAVLEWLDVAHLADKRPGTLSGGEQQRAAIARALIGRPEVLLADEPTNALEDTQARRLLATFQELVEMGTTVIVATHNEVLIRETPAASIILQDGTLAGTDIQDGIAALRSNKA